MALYAKIYYYNGFDVVEYKIISETQKQCHARPTNSNSYGGQRRFRFDECERTSWDNKYWSFSKDKVIEHLTWLQEKETKNHEDRMNRLESLKHKIQ